MRLGGWYLCLLGVGYVFGIHTCCWRIFQKKRYSDLNLPKWLILVTVFHLPQRATAMISDVVPGTSLQISVIWPSSYFSLLDLLFSLQWHCLLQWWMNFTLMISLWMLESIRVLFFPYPLSLTYQQPQTTWTFFFLLSYVDLHPSPCKMNAFISLFPTLILQSSHSGETCNFVILNASKIQALSISCKQDDFQPSLIFNNTSSTYDASFSS